MTDFWKKVFCDFDGNPSFARVASVPLIIAVTGVFVFYSVKTMHLPTKDEAEALAMVGGFLYFGNQFKAVTAAVKGFFSSTDQKS